jgi:membrane-bound lytic murein transglycosylase F
VKIIKEFDYLLDSLESGMGDLAAGNITITQSRKARFDFSPEIFRTRMVLVQRLPENRKKLSRAQIKARMVQDALELNGKTLYVNANSSFYERINNLIEENGLDINLQTVASELGTDELIRMVAEHQIDYTVVDENVARIHQAFYDNIDISVPLSLNQSIAWAIPKGNEALKNQLENWVDERKNSTKYKAIYNKYFGSTAALRSKENFLAIGKGQISAYDDLIKKHAQFIEWDWLLLAALINKESKFNPDAVSPFGATGLMQVMPKTGARFGVSEELLTNPDLNIMAGTRFLMWLDKFWESRIDDPEERVNFVLASYNAGQGHVLDAMKLADKYGLDSQKWFDNVEVMMRNKSQPQYYQDPLAKSGYCNCIETVTFVRVVKQYHENYKMHMERLQAEKPAVQVAVK